MKTAVIIGGGIAGLVAGVYSAQSGFKTTIIESHTIPGGNSTAWKRNGYHFEGGMHWLTGSSDKASLNRIWREVGALKENNPIHIRDPFVTYISENGEKIDLCRDVDKLEKTLTSIAPQDKKAIAMLCKDVRAMSKLSMPVTDIKGVKVKYPAKISGAAMLKMMGVLPAMARLQKISAGEYADKFTHEGLRAIMHNIVGLDSFNAMSFAVTLGTLASGDGGYPKGGALQMAQNIADTFTALGGTIKYRTRADKIIVKNNKAAGVRLDNGEELFADAVICTQDLLTAKNTLFENGLNEPWLEQMERETTPLNCTFVCLGVRADLKHMPDSFIIPFKKPVNLAGTEYKNISFNNYANYAGYSPNGCTALTSYLGKADTYDYWKNAKDDNTYAEKKAKLAKDIIEGLETEVLHQSGLTEVWDVATPLTYERYCSTYRGSWMSVLGTEKTRQTYPVKSETVSGLYFAGQRLYKPGGLPGTAFSARQAAQHMCADNGAVFQALL